jgi:nitrous oxidase accessory protein NosD
MSDGGAQDCGTSDSALVDESLIDAMLALSPEERLRQNDRMVRTILLLRQGWEAARSGQDSGER